MFFINSNYKMKKFLVVPFLLFLSTFLCQYFYNYQIPPEYNFFFTNIKILDDITLSIILRLIGSAIILTTALLSHDKSFFYLSKYFLYVVYWNIIWTFRFRHGDFDCYLRSVDQLLLGENIWKTREYLYPPLLTELLLGLKKIFLYFNFNDWKLATFWIYLTFQWIGIYYFLEAIGKLLKTSNPLIFILPLFLEPFWSTLQHSQLTLWMMPIIFGACALYSFPMIAGLCIAIGINLKIYPIIIFAIWLITMRFKHLFWGIFFTILIAFITFYVIPEKQILTDWLLTSKDTIFTNNSGIRVHNFYNLIFQTFDGFSVEKNVSSSIAKYAKIFLTIIFSVIILIREKRWRKGSIPVEVRITIHCAYAILMATLLSPIAWHHHYILALPLITLLLFYKKNLTLTLILISIICIILGQLDIFPIFHFRTISSLLLIFMPLDLKEINSYYHKNDE